MITERERKARKVREGEAKQKSYLLSLSDSEAVKLSPSEWYTRHRYLSELAAAEYIRNIRRKIEHNAAPVQTIKCHKSTYYEREDSF